MMQTAPQTPSQSFTGTGSVIKSFVRLREVAGGVACLNFGRRTFEYRSILKINTVNFALMSEDDQDALIEGFKTFLNGIAFPIQILIRNLPYRLDEYLDSMAAVQGDLAEVMKDHVDFVRQLASRRALVKRVFYIIVPADATTSRNRDEALLNAQTQLKLRTDELLRQLARMGLSGRRLTDQEIITLYHSCFATEEARRFPMSDGLIEGVNRLMVSTRDHAAEGQNSRYIETEEEEEQAQDQRKSKSKKAKAKQKEAKGKDRIPDFVSVPELIAPSSMQIFPWYVRIDGETGQEFV